MAEKGYTTLTFRGISYLVESALKEVRVKGGKTTIKVCSKITDSWKKSRRRKDEYKL